MKTFASMFTGGGGADVGATLAGLDHLWGIEWSSDICSVAWLNGYPTINADVRAVNYGDLTRPDWLHASPPCINASVANNKKGESDLDMELAQAVCRAIVALKPDYFSLENVRGYATFKAYQAIKECLLANDYKYIDGILNAADYGTPQTRIRLFLVASRVSTPKLPLPTHYDARSGAMNMLLKPWIGWHEAIKDLLDDLPDAEFAPWQLKRLPDELRKLATPESQLVLAANTRNPGFFVPPIQPSYTLTTNGNPKAYLIGGGNTNTSEQRDRPVRNVADPAYLISGGNKQESPLDGQVPSYTVLGNSGSDRAYIGRVVKLTPRCLARFNGLPDSYQLPSQQSLACKVLGNMVMPLVMAALIRSTIQQ